MPSTNRSLEAILTRGKEGRQFFERYTALKQLFNSTIHPQVTQLASASDSVFLTDHGPDHIAKVIDKADALVRQARDSLNPYEAFLLLVAIHFHDVGNALGRTGHEKRISEILEVTYGPLGFDQFDRVLAGDIARVHGGTYDGSKDTIKTLEDSTLWNDERVRPQYLAALLRLADEMSDIRQRSNATAVELNTIPHESQIYHVYAYGLHSVEADVSAGMIRMKFAFAKKYFLSQLGKGNREAHLLDEIFDRTMKMLFEADYCSRYFKGSIRIDRVSVEIDVFKDQFSGRIMKIPYQLELPRYRHDKADIYDCAPTLAHFHRQKRLTSSTLRSILNKGS